jgi:hypothetical protein
MMPYKDPQKRAEYHRQYMIDHPTPPEKRREATARYRATHPSRPITASKRRERRYGLTAERHEKVMLDQGGLCACCKSAPPIDVDHCHKTGHFRGLLCRSCNIGLGCFKDDPDKLRLAIDYLSKPTMRLGDRIPRKKQVYGRGQDSSAAKLNDGKVREMRREYAIGDVSYADLGRKIRRSQRIRWPRCPTPMLGTR